MTADMITAEQALQYGLVNHVTEPEQLMAKCLEIIEKIKSKSPKAITGVINSVNAYFENEVDGFHQEIKEFGKCFATEDFKEGTAAFLEKRKANFAGK
jgi:enoyl-CoA hydratase